MSAHRAIIESHQRRQQETLKMAKYYITHTCGHEVTHQLVGTNRRGERDRKEAWLKGSLCTGCWKEEQDAERDKQRAEKLEEAKESAKDLPELTGSPKQINWAMTIRNDAMEVFKYLLDKSTKANQKEPCERGTLSIKCYQDHIDHYGSIALAKTWIENRPTKDCVITNAIFKHYIVKNLIPARPAS